MGILRLPLNRPRPLSPRSSPLRAQRSPLPALSSRPQSPHRPPRRPLFRAVSHCSCPSLSSQFRPASNYPLDVGNLSISLLPCRSVPGIARNSNVKHAPLSDAYVPMTGRLTSMSLSYPLANRLRLLRPCGGRLPGLFILHSTLLWWQQGGTLSPPGRT